MVGHWQEIMDWTPPLELRLQQADEDFVGASALPVFFIDHFVDVGGEEEPQE